MEQQLPNKPTGASEALKASSPIQNATERISVEEFTQVTFNAVLRAGEAQKSPRGPIIYGIIYMPEGSSFGTTTGV